MREAQLIDYIPRAAYASAPFSMVIGVVETTDAAKRALSAPWRTELAALMTLGLPMAATQLVQFSVMTVDVLMIGRLGPEPLAASSLGVVIFFAAWLIGFGPAIAVSPLVSQALGANDKDYDDVRISVRMALWTNGMLTAPVFVGFALTEQIALALEEPPQLAHLAGPYVLALAPGWAFAMGTIILRNFLAAIGETRAPLYIVIGTTLMNAFLNWLLIYGNWDFRGWSLSAPASPPRSSTLAAFSRLSFSFARTRARGAFICSGSF
jgi:MATE family multidrug resistance protein